MKNVVYVLVITFLVILIQSCSSSDNATTNNNPPFVGVKLTSIQYPNGTVETFTYNGNQLDRVTKSSGTYRKYTYQGSLVSKMEFCSSTNQVVSIVEFTYNGINLIKQKEYATDGSYLKEINYTHNGNSTINVNMVLYNGTTLIDSGQYKFFINAQGNRYKVEDLNSSDITNYTYDSKNTPYKNIIGYDLLLFEYNNVTQSTSSTITVTKTLQYNSQDYPTSVSQVNAPGGNMGTVTYSYQ